MSRQQLTGGLLHFFCSFFSFSLIFKNLLLFRTLHWSILPNVPEHPVATLLFFINNSDIWNKYFGSEIEEIEKKWVLLCLI